MHQENCCWRCTLGDGTRCRRDAPPTAVPAFIRSRANADSDTTATLAASECKGFVIVANFASWHRNPAIPFTALRHRSCIPLAFGGKLAKRTKNTNRVSRKRSGRKRSDNVSVMPLVIKTSPEDTQGVIRAALDDSAGAPRAVIPVAVKGKKTVRKRAAVIPVAVKTLPQSARMMKRIKRRPEAIQALTLRSAVIGIADEFIEAERNFFRLGIYYLREIAAALTNTVLGRTMARFEQQIEATQFNVPRERTEHDTLLVA